MAMKKVRVLGAIVDGKKKGEVFEVESKTADMLIRNRYVELVKEEKKKPAPKKDKPKGEEKEEKQDKDKSEE